MNSTVLSVTTLVTVNDSLIHLNFSATMRLTRHLVHVLILFIFIALLTYVNRRHSVIRRSNRPCSHLSRFLVSIGIIGLVLNDFLVINGVTHQTWCSIHHLCLQLLLTIIVASRLLPDFYEYSNSYYHHNDSGTSKLSVLLSLSIIILIQLFISIQWLWKNPTSSHVEWNPPVFCPSCIRPQLFILFLHLLELIFISQSLHSPNFSYTDNGVSSMIVFVDEKLYQLNSILLRLFYFLGTSVLHVFFWPGQFSATFYAGIIVIESILILFYDCLSREYSI